MKKRLILASVLALMLLLGGVGPSQAQGPVDPEGNAVFTVQSAGGDVLGNLSTGFTYQGQLKKNGTPVNGTCDFQFSLYDRSSTTTPVQLGTTETQTGVAVNNGLFTVILNFSNQFGADAFNGQGRALGIQVRCPAGSGSYTNLTSISRQPLWAAPFAQTLRPGSKIVGSIATGGEMLRIDNTGTGGGLTIISHAGTALWANAGAGIGADVRSTSGTALSVGGTGRIYSTADSKLYLSPHTLVVRNSPNVEVTALDGGGVKIVLPASTTSYVSIPMSTFGTLFGSQVYVKSLRICYKTAGTTIDALTISKNTGTEGGAAYYIFNDTDRSSGTYLCETFIADTPRLPVDNSSWVQLNLRTLSGGPREVYIYTVEVTLTEHSTN